MMRICSVIYVEDRYATNRLVHHVNTALPSTGPGWWRKTGFFSLGQLDAVELHEILLVSMPGWLDIEGKGLSSLLYIQLTGLWGTLYSDWQAWRQWGWIETLTWIPLGLVPEWNCAHSVNCNHFLLLAAQSPFVYSVLYFSYWFIIYLGN